MGCESRPEGRGLAGWSGVHDIGGTKYEPFYKAPEYKPERSIGFLGTFVLAVVYALFVYGVWLAWR